MHKHTNCIYLSGKGFRADLVQSLLECTTSLILNTLVPLLPSLSGFSSCGTTWPYVPAALRTQPCSRGFAGHEGRDTRCYAGRQPGPKSDGAAVGVCAADTSLLTPYQSFRLKQWRNYRIMVLNYLGLFWMFTFTKKKKSPFLKLTSCPLFVCNPLVINLINCNSWVPS